MDSSEYKNEFVSEARDHMDTLNEDGTHSIISICGDEWLCTNFDEVMKEANFLTKNL